MSYAKKLVDDFLQLSTSTTLQLSWGKPDDFDTFDPYDRVKIRDNKLVLKYDPVIDEDPTIDIVKGLVYYYLHQSLHNTYSGWSFATLTSLVILPSTVISNSKKTQYRKQWLVLKPYVQNLRMRHDYERWYRILSSYNRLRVMELLRKFIVEGFVPGPVVLEDQFTEFLFSMIQSLYTLDDLDFIHTALKLQATDLREIKKSLPHLKKAQLYDLRSRLDFQINQFFLPSYKNLGLTKIYIEQDIDRKEDVFSEHSFFENIEAFEFTDFCLMKLGFPIRNSSKLLSFVNKFSFGVYVYIPDLFVIKKTPLMYDIRNSRWSSVFHHKRESIVFEPFKLDKSSLSKLTQQDIDILVAVLQARSENHRKLSLQYSQSQTKRGIIKIQEKNLYTKAVLWRRPSDLATLGMIFPVSDYKEVSIKDWEEDFLLKTKPPINNPALQEVIDLSWPYLSLEFCVEVRKLANKLVSRLVVIVRVCGHDNDLLRLTGYTAKKKVLGVYVKSPGTSIRFPTQHFESGSWDFDFEKFEEILKM